MAGQRLVSGNPQNYSAIGEAGQPIYAVAFQLREAVRLKAGADVANCLALPQRNEQGSVIDWYAPESGDVIPWSAATSEEREHALIMLDAAQRKLDEAVRQMASTEARTDHATREKKTALPLLDKVFIFPDSDFIFLVNGKPVVTFWGFNAQGASLPTDPFVKLRPVVPAPGVAQPLVPTKRRAWWWWLLLLLLLLMLLLLLLRSCGAPPWLVQAVPLLEHLQLAPDNAVTPQRPTGTPSIPTSPTNKPEVLPERRVGVPGGVGVQTDSTTIITNGGPNSNPGVGPNLNPGVAPPPALVDPANTLKELRPNPSAVPEASGSLPVTNPQGLLSTPPNLPLETGRQTENSRPELNTTTPQSNAANGTNTATPIATSPTPNPNNQVPGAGATGQQGNPMLIPDSALNSGSTRFLEGSWSAGAGIQDAATGKPVRLEYDFSQGNGQGRVTVKRGDGVQCTGSVGAQMQGRTVQINDRGTAKCTDGSTMALPKVTCTPGAGNQAACQGQYDNGTSFPVSMRHLPK
ncbi:MAG: SrfA family protein [Alcaligenaceae bacterium]